MNFLLVEDKKFGSEFACFAASSFGQESSGFGQNHRLTRQP